MQWVVDKNNRWTKSTEEGENPFTSSVNSHPPVLLLKQRLSGSAELKSVRQSVKEMAILDWQTQWGCGHGNSTIPVRLLE